MGLPEVNIGLVGHIDHGKTTLTEALTGVWTDKHSEELKRGITIKLGYADVTFYKCPKCDEPQSFTPQDKCMHCQTDAEEIRTISFVDAPGHETLMATMLSGASLMDGAIIVIAANEECPQNQTKEHLMALDILGVDKIIIVQNKIDLVSVDQAKKNYQQIKDFVKGTVAENAPVIPISAQHGLNLDVLIQTIEDIIPTPEVNADADPIMYIARSFDINKPGSTIDKLKGGIIGGALVQGTLKSGQEVEMGPSASGGTFKTKIINITAGGKSVDSVTRGGTFGAETLLDPYYLKSDKLVGKVLSYPGKLPPIRSDLDLEVHLLERVVGSEEELEIKPLFKGGNPNA